MYYFFVIVFFFFCKIIYVLLFICLSKTFIQIRISWLLQAHKLFVRRAQNYTKKCVYQLYTIQTHTHRHLNTHTLTHTPRESRRGTSTHTCRRARSHSYALRISLISFQYTIRFVLYFFFLFYFVASAIAAFSRSIVFLLHSIRFFSLFFSLLDIVIRV